MCGLAERKNGSAGADDQLELRVARLLDRLFGELANVILELFALLLAERRASAELRAQPLNAELERTAEPHRTRVADDGLDASAADVDDQRASSCEIDRIADREINV